MRGKYFRDKWPVFGCLHLQGLSFGFRKRAILTPRLFSGHHSLSIIPFLLVSSAIVSWYDRVCFSAKCCVKIPSDYGRIVFHAVDFLCDCHWQLFLDFEIVFFLLIFGWRIIWNNFQLFHPDFEPPYSVSWRMNSKLDTFDWWLKQKANTLFWSFCIFSTPLWASVKFSQHLRVSDPLWFNALRFIFLSIFTLVRVSNNSS